MDRQATAVWKGTLKEGSGTIDTQSGPAIQLNNSSAIDTGNLMGK